MKKFRAINTKILVLAVAMVLVFTAGCGNKNNNDPAPGDTGSSEIVQTPEVPPGDIQRKTIGFYADSDNKYYTELNNALNALADQDPVTDWTVDFKVGQGTADEQLTAVEEFITADYDAIIVIQNNSETTKACIELTKEARIPFFTAVSDITTVSNYYDVTGSSHYNFEQAGRLAGQNALANGVRKLVVIDSGYGRNTDTDLTIGFLLAYEEAGRSLGEKADGSWWTAEQIVAQKPPLSDIRGEYDLAVVSWNTMPSPDTQVMANVVATLGADGWNGVYVHDNSMVEAVVDGLKEQELSSKNYWLGTINGSEKSWQWAKDEIISFDVNQSALLEGAIMYQMLKEYFAKGSVSRSHIHPYLTDYTKHSIIDLEPRLVPQTNIPAFLEGINNGYILIDINDPRFEDVRFY